MKMVSVKVYLQTSQEEMWDKGGEIGMLTEARSNFSRLMNEVEANICANVETGTAVVESFVYGGKTYTTD